MNSNNLTALPRTPLSESKRLSSRVGKGILIPQKAQTINFIGSCSKRMKGLGFKVGFGFRVYMHKVITKVTPHLPNLGFSLGPMCP